MIKTKIAIVGAGPAGSICAITLQKAGVECLLIDKAEFPRDKLCGGGLQPHAWKLLESILPDFKYEYRTLSQLKMSYNGELKGTYSLKDPMRIVQRKVFDSQLVQEYIKLGGKMLHENLHTVEEHPEGMLLNMRSGDTVVCQHLIGADGANSRVRKFLQPDFRSDILCLEQYEPIRPNQEPELLIDFSTEYDNGYYYEFPASNYIAVGYGDNHTRIETFRKHLKAHGYPERQILGAMITISQDYPHHDRITLVGDAGGWTDNLTAEGIHYAIATGYNAAQAIIQNVPFSQVNAAIERKKRHKLRDAKYFYTPIGMWLVRHALSHKKVIELLLNRYFG